MIKDTQKTVISIGLLCLFWLSLSHAAEPDYARESRLADEIVDIIFDGDAQWLSANEREFLTIYTETDDAKTAVVVMHGRGFHPDWEDVVNPLRVGLVDRGYTTLSLQMPVLQKDAKYYDYVPIFPESFARIEAGIDFLKSNGYQKIYLIAHSCSVHMVMDWVRQHGDSGIDAFVGLGMGATDYKQPMRRPFPLDKMKVPILDLYGTDEFPAVLKMAAQRKAAIEAAGHPNSKQLVLSDADHFFVDKGDELTAAIANWFSMLD